MSSRLYGMNLTPPAVEHATGAGVSWHPTRGLKAFGKACIHWHWQPIGSDGADEHDMATLTSHTLPGVCPQHAPLKGTHDPFREQHQPTTSALHAGVQLMLVKLASGCLPGLRASWSKFPLILSTFRPGRNAGSEAGRLLNWLLLMFSDSIEGMLPSW